MRAFSRQRSRTRLETGRAWLIDVEDEYGLRRQRQGLGAAAQRGSAPVPIVRLTATRAYEDGGRISSAAWPSTT
jgi:hypothetical protein